MSNIFDVIVDLLKPL